MSKEPLLKSLEDLKKKYEDAVSKCGRPTFLAMAQKAFDGCELLQRISWSQVTPSFNDGDPCYFQVHDATFFGDEDEELCTYSYRDRKAVKGVEALNDFNDFIQSEVGSDLCERVFGDGFTVTITRDGSIETDDYYD